MLCLDPGGTIGYAIFRHGELERAGQWPVAVIRDIEKLIDAVGPVDHIIMESYRIYPWMLERHSFSDVPTLRYIGALQMLASQRRIPVTLQAAAVAKEFATDGKLRAWGLYQRGKKHANDAIRHGVHFLLFHR